MLDEILVQRVVFCAGYRIYGEQKLGPHLYIRCFISSQVNFTFGGTFGYP